MKTLFSKACLWFFGSIIVFNVLFSSTFEGMSVIERILSSIAIGFVVGGFAFCKWWYKYEQEEEKKIKN